MRDKSAGMFGCAWAPFSNQTVLTSKVVKDSLSGHSQQQTNKQTNTPSSQSLLLISGERSLFLKFRKWFRTDLQTGTWQLLPTFFLLLHKLNAFLENDTLGKVNNNQLIASAAAAKGHVCHHFDWWHYMVPSVSLIVPWGSIIKAW